MAKLFSDVETQEALARAASQSLGSLDPRVPTMGELFPKNPVLDIPSAYRLKEEDPKEEDPKVVEALAALMRIEAAINTLLTESHWLYKENRIGHAHLMQTNNRVKFELTTLRDAAVKYYIELKDAS